MKRSYLEHIKIVSFGAFSNKAVGPFAPHLNVVYGPNEAGKTTLASFVGGVLFGWEEARGSRNTYVLILQDALNALGYSTNTLDGIFGHATENALKACQRRFGLTATAYAAAPAGKRSPRQRWGSAKRRRLLILDLSAGIINLPPSGMEAKELHYII